MEALRLRKMITHLVVLTNRTEKARSGRAGVWCLVFGDESESTMIILPFLVTGMRIAIQPLQLFN